MKKLENLFMIAIVAFFSLTMFSCGDDDESVGDVDNLIGTWSLIQDEGYEKYSGKTDSWNDTYEEGKKIIVFSADHKISGSIDLEEGTTWSYKGNKLTFNFPPDEDETGVEVFTVLELTSTRLVIECYEKNGKNEMYMKMTFKKR